MNYREYRNTVQDAIEGRAKCPAVYQGTQPIKFSMDGKVLFNGKVEVFQLKDHPQAKLAFGWGFENDKKKWEYITVLGVPPLDTPLAAVKGYVAARRT